MAEIIRPNFGGKPPQKPTEGKPAQTPPTSPDQISLWGLSVAEETQATSPGPRTPEQIQADSDWINDHGNEPTKQAFKERITRVNEFVYSLRGYTPTKEDIRIRRAGFKDMHIVQLISLITTSDEAKWRQHPSYYIALRIEINSRAIIAKSNN